MYICVLEVSIFPFSTIFHLDLGTVPTVWYFLFLFVFTQKYIIEKKPIDIKWNIV